MIRVMLLKDLSHYAAGLAGGQSKGQEGGCCWDAKSGGRPGTGTWGWEAEKEE